MLATHCDHFSPSTNVSRLSKRESQAQRERLDMSLLPLSKVSATSRSLSRDFATANKSASLHALVISSPRSHFKYFSRDLVSTSRAVACTENWREIRFRVLIMQRKERKIAHLSYRKAVSSRSKPTNRISMFALLDLARGLIVFHCLLRARADSNPICSGPECFGFWQFLRHFARLK